jgi:hypothetical protein
VMKQKFPSVMGKRRGVFRKLVAFMCSFRHGKTRSDSGCSVSPAEARRAIQEALACDGATSSDEEMLEPEISVSIAGTAISG